MSAKFRYTISRATNGWAVIDSTKIRMHNDMVELLKTRTAARTRARELNLLEMRERNTTGDAA